MRANGTALRSIRTGLNLSVAEAARAIGISEGHLARVERGEVGASATTLQALARLYGVEADDLTKGGPVPDVQAASTVRDVADLSDMHLYKAPQVAVMTQLPKQWLLRKAGKREIPCTYMGRYPRWSAEDVRELIAMNRIDPKTGLPRLAAPVSRRQQRTKA